MQIEFLSGIKIIFKRYFKILEFIVSPVGGDRGLSLWMSHWTNSLERTTHWFIQYRNKWLTWVIHLITHLTDLFKTLNHSPLQCVSQRRNDLAVVSCGTDGAKIVSNNIVSKMYVTQYHVLINSCHVIFLKAISWESMLLFWISAASCQSCWYSQQRSLS